MTLPSGSLSRLFLALVVFSLAGSLFSRLTGLDPGPIAPVASVLTLAAGVGATFAAYVRAVPHAYFRIALALALGASMEIVGLETGFPFGRYAYTGAWWPTVVLPHAGRFPLLLPFAWLLMAGASTLSVMGRRLQPAKASQALASLLGGLLAALVDLAMEPVMAGRLGYWRWLAPGPLPGGAPVANFLAWWAVAALAGLILTLGTKLPRDEAPRWVLGGFVALILGLGVVGR